MASGQWTLFAVNGSSSGTWGTTGNINRAESGLWVMSHGLKREDAYERTDSPGQYTAGEMVGGSKIVPPTQLVCRWQYRGACPKLLALGTGPDSLTGSVHSLTPAGVAGFVGRMASAGIREIATAPSTYRYEEVPSFKVTGWELRGSIPGFLEVVFDIQADDLLRGGDETLDDMANVTHCADTDFQPMTGDFFKMANLGVDVSSVGISSFSLKHQVPHRADHVSAAGNTIPEPIDNGPLNMTLTVSRPRKSDTSWVVDFDDRQQQSVEMAFSGEGSNALSIFIPKLEITSHDAPHTGADFLTETMEMTVLEDHAGTAHTNVRDNMDTDTDPFQIDITNGWATDYDTEFPA